MQEIGELTLWEVDDLMSYWKDYPPTHVLVAAYLMGGKRQRRKLDSGKSLEELFHAVSLMGGTSVGKLPQSYRTK